MGTTSSTSARHRDTLQATFIPAAFVMMVGLMSHFVFDMESGRAFNVVFALATGTAVVTGALLGTTEPGHPGPGCT